MYKIGTQQRIALWLGDSNSNMSNNKRENMRKHISEAVNFGVAGHIALVSSSVMHLQ